MKIEKGKLYYNTALGKIEKATHSYEIEEGLITDKIAVHCPTKEDKEYIFKVILGHTNIPGELYDNWYFNLHTNDWCIKDSGYWSGKLMSRYHIITIDQFKEFYPESVISNKTDDNVQNTQPHYDNTHGSLYKIAEQRKWNSYQFDIVKRIDRSLKKGQFKEDLQKTKDLIDLWLREESN